MSSFSLAWECGSYDKYSQPVEKHLEIATDVFIGTVLEGKLEDSYSIDLKLKVTLPIKGNLKTEVELTTNSEPINDRFYIGGHYIVFLYGSSKIDFCNMILEVVTPVNSLDELKEYVKRKDIEGTEKVGVVAKYLSNNP